MKMYNDRLFYFGFDFYHHFPTSDAEYYNILKSVENHHNGIKLTIEFTSSGYFVEHSQFIFSMRYRIY